MDFGCYFEVTVTELVENELNQNKGAVLSIPNINSDSGMSVGFI